MFNIAKFNSFFNLNHYSDNLKEMYLSSKTCNERIKIIKLHEAMLYVSLVMYLVPTCILLIKEYK